MFDTATYKRRRDELKKLVKEGIIILFGNNESPANFPNNGYFPFRQDSSFLYYYGLQRDGLVGVIDIDNDKDLLAMISTSKTSFGMVLWIAWKR